MDICMLFLLVMDQYTGEDNEDIEAVEEEEDSDEDQDKKEESLPATNEEEKQEYLFLSDIHICLQWALAQDDQFL